jgi:hypothetical protein
MIEQTPIAAALTFLFIENAIDPDGWHCMAPRSLLQASEPALDILKHRIEEGHIDQGEHG